jgi:WD40 repeat protein
MPDQDRSGEQIGDYRLVQKLGQGSFGAVYEAEHIYLGKRFALKLLHALHLDQAEAEHLLDEARKLAVLEHPHIVQVHNCSMYGEIPFLVLQLAQGSLKGRFPLGEQPPVEMVLPLVRQAAEGLHYIHEHRIVHLDIKPANLLLGGQGQVLLSDFGLSLVLQTLHTHQTMQGFAGTPTYAAPEQFEERGHVGPASDQYALAATVYEWLAGTPPFQGGWYAIGMQKLTQDPPSLRLHRPDLPSAVEQVVLRALAKDPKARFPTVRAFAEALTQAVQPPKTPKSARRGNPRRASVAFLTRPPIGTLLATCQGQSDWVWGVAWAPDGTRLASARRDQTMQVWDAASGKLLITCQGHTDWVWGVAWSPDGSCLASVSADKTVCVWEAASGRLLLTSQKHTSVMFGVAWSPDGRSLASANGDQTVRVWSATSGRVLFTCEGHTDWVWGVAWAPNGTQFASVSWDDTVRVWEAVSGKLLLICLGHSGRVRGVAWAPDSSRLASASGDQTVRIWDGTSGKLHITCRGHTNWVWGVAWSPDGSRIASASGDNTVRIWEAATGLCLFVYRGHTAAVNAVAWSPDGSRIASASDDGTVQVWSAG